MQKNNELEVFVGTAGFSYSHWKCTSTTSKSGLNFFYPSHCPKEKELCHYSSVFNSVEINTSFYGTPSLKSLLSWKSQVMQSTPLLPSPSSSIDNNSNNNNNDHCTNNSITSGKSGGGGGGENISRDFRFSFKILQTISHRLLPSITKLLDNLVKGNMWNEKEREVLLNDIIYNALESLKNENSDKNQSYEHALDKDKVLSLQETQIDIETKGGSNSNSNSTISHVPLGKDKNYSNSSPSYNVGSIKTMESKDKDKIIIRLREEIYELCNTLSHFQNRVINVVLNDQNLKNNQPSSSPPSASASVSASASISTSSPASAATFQKENRGRKTRSILLAPILIQFPPSFSYTPNLFPFLEILLKLLSEEANLYGEKGCGSELEGGTKISDNENQKQELTLQFKKEFRYCFEFRSLTWYEPKYYEILHDFLYRNNWTLCLHAFPQKGIRDFIGSITKLQGEESLLSDNTTTFDEINKTIEKMPLYNFLGSSDTIYWRLHGLKEEHAWDYTKEELMHYITLLNAFIEKKIPSKCPLNKCRPIRFIYIYFLNDADANATKNAFSFLQLWRKTNISSKYAGENVKAKEEALLRLENERSYESIIKEGCNIGIIKSITSFFKKGKSPSNIPAVKLIANQSKISQQPNFTSALGAQKKQIKEKSQQQQQQQQQPQHVQKEERRETLISSQYEDKNCIDLTTSTRKRAGDKIQIDERGKADPAPLLSTTKTSVASNKRTKYGTASISNLFKKK